MGGLDHTCWILGFSVLESVMKCKAWKIKNAIIFQLVFMIAVNAGHRNVGKHMSDFGQRSLRRSKLEMSDLNTVT